jgi:hypothetical protein
MAMNDAEKRIQRMIGEFPEHKHLFIDLDDAYNALNRAVKKLDALLTAQANEKAEKELK